MGSYRLVVCINEVKSALSLEKDEKKGIVC